MTTKDKKTPKIVIILLVIILLVLLVALLVWMLYSPKDAADDNIQVKNDMVCEDELNMFMEFCKSQVAASLYEQYGIEFGESSYDERIGDITVYEYWKKEALSEIARYRAMVTLAITNDVLLINSYSYDDFCTAMDNENAVRQSKISNGEIVYGIKHFTAKSYYSYITSNMKIQTIAVLQKNDNAWSPTQTQLKEYYELNKDLYKAVDSYEFDEYIFNNDISKDKLNELRDNICDGKDYDSKLVTTNHISLSEENYSDLSKNSYSIYEEAINLVEGQASQVLNYNGVRFFLICKSRKAGGYRDFNEYKEELLQNWLSDKYDEYIMTEIEEPQR